MTWLKLSDDFDFECADAGLSDAAVRTHLDGLLWTMRRLTNGWVKDDDIRRVMETKEDPESVIQELLATGFWKRTNYGYLIIHSMEHQRTPEQVEAALEKGRKRQATYRERNAVSNAVSNAPQTRPDQTSSKSKDLSASLDAKQTSLRAEERLMQLLKEGALTENSFENRGRIFRMRLAGKPKDEIIAVLGIQEGTYRHDVSVIRRAMATVEAEAAGW